MTGNRPVYSPPAAPPRQVPVVPPPLPSVLAGVPAVDRWHYYRLFALWGAGLAADGWAVWQAVVTGPGLYWAGIVGLGLVAAWVGTHRDYQAALYHANTARVAQAEKLTAELAEWQASLDTERRVLEAWSAHEHGPVKAAPAPPAGPTVHHAQQQEQQQTALRAALVAETVKAVVAELAPLLQPAPVPERARVDAPAAEVETRHLDNPALLLQEAYDRGPTYRLISAAWRKEPITSRAMVAHMTDDEWRDLTKRLEGWGILARKGAGPTAPFALAPAFADTPTEAACRVAVLTKLAAVGCGPQTLPGDLHAR